MNDVGEPLPPSVERVAAALKAAGHSGRIRMLPRSARTAAEAASAIGCSVAEIAKSIIFRAASGRHVMVIASGTNRVDEKKVAAVVGEKLGKADAEFVRERTGFAIGGVPPLAHAAPPVVVIDRDLAHFERIWAAAGHPHSVFPLSFAELSELTGGLVAAIA